MLVHVRPVVLAVRAETTVARVLRADAERDGGHSPVTPFECAGDRVARSEVPPGPGPDGSSVRPEARSAC